MSKILALTVMIFLAGTLAIAWTGPPSDETSVTSPPPPSTSPSETRLNLVTDSRLTTDHVPITPMDDRSMVFVGP
jgi:hypothetical protein